MELPDLTKPMCLCSNCSKNKTYKRETAWCLLLFWVGTVAMGILQADTSMVSIITPPIFLFVGAAFTMDWSAKQNKKKEV